MVACKAKVILIPSCSWMLKIGVSPLLLNVHLTSLLSHQDHPEQLAVLSSTTAGTLCTLLSSYRLVTCPSPSAFMLTFMEGENE